MEHGTGKCPLHVSYYTHNNWKEKEKISSDFPPRDNELAGVGRVIPLERCVM